ncbi:hypothetical protein [Burkholderia pseudomallei]|uniref:hypothetical protein n=1 Tax=Burkholderia pseudomallei TaxID=28450 RepID=UPI0011775994|nr:hypothetical protein [Burkholderia pseudomallei]
MKMKRLAMASLAAAALAIVSLTIYVDSRIDQQTSRSLRIAKFASVSVRSVLLADEMLQNTDAGSFPALCGKLRETIGKASDSPAPSIWESGNIHAKTKAYLTSTSRLLGALSDYRSLTHRIHTTSQTRDTALREVSSFGISPPKYASDIERAAASELEILTGKVAPSKQALMAAMVSVKQTGQNLANTIGDISLPSSEIQAAVQRHHLSQ